MFDDILLRGLLAGIGVALFASPIGCFVVWRRMAYFGDTIAHAGVLGVAIALALEINFSFGILFVASLISFAMIGFGTQKILSSDALLGIFSHAALSIGLIVVSLLPDVDVDIEHLLFGDILNVSLTEVALIWGGGSIALLILTFIWQPLLAITVSPEIAQAESRTSKRAEALFLLLIALVAASAIKVVGVLLITSLLIIPAATARSFTNTPESMAIGAAIVGVVAVICGLMLSLWIHTPSGPSIVLAAFVLFLASLLTRRFGGSQ